MDENPYQSPKIASGWSPGLTSKLQSLRAIVAWLIGALLCQWLCHFLTAVAMFAWMEKVEGGPTSKIFDSLFYGFCCVGFTAVLSLLAGVFAMRALKRSDDAPKSE